jgi:aryl-alcohol dehydrogenase-like predicted oxidoreductase
MKYRSLGGSGLKVSAIGLGTNQFGRKVDLHTSKEIIQAALDAGINLIDTADVYSSGLSEEFIGEALAGKRDQALIATKVRHPIGDDPNHRGASRMHILEGVDASLRRLKTDYVDLYQIHSWDPEPPVAETMRALEDLLRWGKVRYIGASNYAAWQLVRANDVAELRGWTQFVSIQPHYHMLERSIESELIPACQYFNIGILPYFPLAGGFLTGKYKPGQPPPPGSRGETSQYVQRLMTPENFNRLEALTGYAMERGHSMGELAHAWLLAQPQVASVISGATRVEHVQANAASSEWELSEAEVAEINEILNKG